MIPPHLFNMRTLISSFPAGKVAYSISEFIERLDALAIAHLPVKGDETRSGSNHATRYYRLEVDDLVESPWVTVTEFANSITATVSGHDDTVLETPEEACEVLKLDCRSRLSEAGIEPAF